MVKTLKTDRYSCLRYLQLAITNILNASLYIFAKPQNIVASKTEFHQKLQRACCVAFHRMITRKDEGITRNILAALYISIYLPLPRFDEELKRAKHEVIAYVCCLYNVDNLAYLQAMSSGFDKTWYQTKSNILEEFMLQQIKRNYLEEGKSQTFYVECASLLGSKSLHKKFNAFARRGSKRQMLNHTSATFMYGIVTDGIIHEKIRDPPGQRSIYIIPGDPHQESYRLSTYLKYPPTSPVNPNLLAKAGFYFTGYKDRVKCFCCGLSVENWTSSDDVMAPGWHKSDCLMMKKEECGNIPIGSLWNRIYTQRQTTNTNLQSIQLATITSAQHENFLRNLDLKSEAQRGESFISWPTDLRTVNASDFAQSGFFYLGNLDRVQCFSCGGVLRNWNYGDNVEAEHKRHFPHCRMVQRIELQNAPLRPEERPRPTITPSPLVFREPPNPNETEQFNLRTLFSCENPVSPHMRNEDSRFETFDHRWLHKQIRATPRQIAKAGFFFLGERDKVKCWYCNGGLQNWDHDDEPWSEHAKWFPTCEYVLQCKGPDFVHRMVSLFPNLRRPVMRGPLGTPSNANARQRPNSPPPPLIDPRAETKQIANDLQSAMNSTLVAQAVEMGFSHSKISQVIKKRLENRTSMYASLPSFVEDLSENLQGSKSMQSKKSTASFQQGATQVTQINLPEDPSSLEQRVRELQDERKCKICLDNIADVVFVPCGHLCSCVDCAQALRKCPICRCKIEKSIRTYLS
ncbi:E3 ubiquitin-protein ligase XIAP-like isoform X3 [Clavelina lepadiformis]|uniref:E3 ubiquitin-protein ligase XIAP-like isoform X3 n=1 Tax=Clavelina lepadiformis TaxID=159417 RepID=UPI00404349E9